MKNTSIFLLISVVAAILFGLLIQEMDNNRREDSRRDQAVPILSVVGNPDEIRLPGNTNHLYVVHDDKRKVTCYVTSGNTTALYCIPDSEFEQYK